MKIALINENSQAAKNAQVEEVLKKEEPIDALIHLGDLEGGEDFISTHVKCPVYLVSGNNDFFCSLPREREITLGKYKVLITHGHYYYISMGTEMLKEEARARNFDIAMFGHTHRPYLEEREGITLLNPGSLSYPRQEGRMPSYMIMDLEEDGTMKYHMMFLGD